MLRLVLSAPACLAVLLVLFAPAAAQARGGGRTGNSEANTSGGLPTDSSVGVHGMVIKSPLVAETIGRVTLNVTQFSYPGVPERAACRLVIRTDNESEHTVALYTLLRTFSAEKTPLGTWMVPSGKLAPGESSERLYSCKAARYVLIDRTSQLAWPGVCAVEADQRAPCPLEMSLELNIDFLPDPPPSTSGPDAKP